MAEELYGFNRQDTDALLREIGNEGGEVPQFRHPEAGAAVTLVGFTLTSAMSSTATATLTDVDGNSLGSDTVRDPKGLFGFMSSGDNGLAIKQGGKYYVICPKPVQVTFVSDVLYTSGTWQKKTRTGYLYAPGTESAAIDIVTGTECP